MPYKPVLLVKNQPHLNPFESVGMYAQQVHASGSFCAKYEISTKTN
jgi:hypothetical protein